MRYPVSLSGVPSSFAVGGCQLKVVAPFADATAVSGALAPEVVGAAAEGEAPPPSPPPPPQAVSRTPRSAAPTTSLPLRATPRPIPWSRFSFSMAVLLVEGAALFGRTQA